MSLDKRALHAVAPDTPYGLPGTQADPGAAFWLLGEHLPQATRLDEVAARFRRPDGISFREDVFFPLEVEGELAELKLLASRRGEGLPADYLGDLIQAARRPEQRLRTGGELARLLEAEIPGRLHRDALGLLLAGRGDVSPVRQARLFMALDLAIYSALSAAWHFKWAAGEGISMRLRPYEHARDESFAVLFDAAASAGAAPETYDRKGRPQGGNGRDQPAPSPGTPRHPSYPSGHSTYAAAASRLLEYFFSPDTLALDDRRLASRVPADERHLGSPAGVAWQLRQLAGNIGEARLWAGVNWRSDHSFGQRLGWAVADCLIERLRRDRIAPLGLRFEHCPSAADLDALRRLRLDAGAPDAGHDRIGTGGPLPL